jgi:nitrogen regulatory protein P-II 1
MKEVKAYIRHNMVGKVIEALEQAGYTNINLIDVKGIKTGLKQEEYLYSLELAEKYMNVVKIEIVCADHDADRIVEIIGEKARTGQKGDGLVFVTPVEGVVRISNGEPWKDQGRRGITQ